MSFEAELLRLRLGALALRACGVAVSPILLWSALAWPSPRHRRRMVAGQAGRLEVGLAMSALGHVWTAPWQELSDVAAALVGCGHVSGLLMRRMCRWP